MRSCTGIANAQRYDTRIGRVSQFVEMLAGGETIYPQEPSGEAR